MRRAWCVQVRFKAKDYKNSVAMYTASLQVASERMPWEASAIFKDEMSTVLCNRSAAFGAMGEVSRASFVRSQPFRPARSRTIEPLVGRGDAESPLLSVFSPDFTVASKLC